MKVDFVVGSRASCSCSCTGSCCCSQLSIAVIVVVGVAIVVAMQIGLTFCALSATIAYFFTLLAMIEQQQVLGGGEGGKGVQQAQQLVEHRWLS